MILTILTKRELYFSHDTIEIINVEECEDLQGAIKSANGDYILFNLENEVDYNGLQQALFLLENSQSDILCFPGFKQDINAVMNKNLYQENRFQTNFIENITLMEDLFISNKIYKKSFLIENQLYPTTEEESIYHDFVLEAFLHSKEISIQKDIVFSLINTTYPEQKKIHLKKKIVLYKKIIKLFKSNGYETELPKLYSRIVRKDLSSFVDHIQIAENKEEFIKLIKPFLEQIEIPYSSLSVYDRLKYKFLLEDDLDSLEELQTFDSGMSTVSNGKLTSDINLLLNVNIEDSLLEVPEKDIVPVYKVEEISLFKGYLYLKGWIYIKYWDLLSPENILKSLVFKGKTVNFEKGLDNKKRADLINHGYGVNFYDYAGFDQIVELGDISEDTKVYLKMIVGNIEREVYLFDYKYNENYLVVEDSNQSPIEQIELYVSKGFIENSSLTLELGSDLNFDNFDEQSSVISRLAVFHDGNRIGQVPFTSKNVSFGNFLIKNSKDTYKKFKTKLVFQIDLNSFKVNGIWDIQLQISINGKVVYFPVKCFENRILTYTSPEALLYANENKVYLVVNKVNNKTTIINKPVNNSAETEQLKKQVKALSHKINYYENSFSWKITNPLRKVMKKLKKK